MPITKATASSIAPAAKGDLVVGSATNDASVLAVGSANQVLTVDSSTSTGLKWATPSDVSGLTLLSTTSVANATTTISSISGDYKYLLIYFYNLTTSNANPSLSITFNSSSIFSGTRITSWDTNFQSTGLDDAGLTTSFAHSGNGGTSQTGIIQIYNYANTTNHKVIEAVSAYSSSDPYDISNKYSGRLKTTSAITSVTFTWGGTTGLQGTIEIYGGK